MRCAPGPASLLDRKFQHATHSGQDTMTRRRCPMHPSVHTRAHPDKPAVIVAETGETIDYGAMDAASHRAAQMFRAHGLQHEDVAAFILATTPHYYGLTCGVAGTSSVEGKSESYGVDIDGSP